MRPILLSAIRTEMAGRRRFVDDLGARIGDTLPLTLADLEGPREGPELATALLQSAQGPPVLSLDSLRNLQQDIVALVEATKRQKVQVARDFVVLREWHEAATAAGITGRRRPSSTLVSAAAPSAPAASSSGLTSASATNEASIMLGITSSGGATLAGALPSSSGQAPSSSADPSTEPAPKKAKTQSGSAALQKGSSVPPMKNGKVPSKKTKGGDSNGKKRDKPMNGRLAFDSDGEADPQKTKPVHPFWADVDAYFREPSSQDHAELKSIFNEVTMTPDLWCVVTPRSPRTMEALLSGRDTERLERYTNHFHIYI